MDGFDELSEREKLVMMFVIDDFIQRGEAVPSSAVAKSGIVDVSPATIRNVMHGLEDRGLLAQPHTSAGRVPTADGIREYVSYLSNSTAATNQLSNQLAIDLDGGSDDLEAEARRASGVLSEISKMAGLVLGPELNQIRLRDLKLVSLDANRVLAILVSDDGGRLERVCELDEPVDSSTLERMQNYLGELARGKNLTELRQLLREQIDAAVKSYQTRALKLGVQLAREDEPTKLYVEGLFNLLEVEEFASDVNKLKELVKTVEERERLLEVLDKIWDSRSPVALIGSDFGESFDPDLGLVVCGYYQGDEQLGLVGVLGPMRMDYARMIPLVDRVARVLSKS